MQDEYSGRKQLCNTVRKEPLMRRVVLLAAAMLLLFMLQAVAEHTTPNEAQTTETPHTATATPAAAAADDECQHINLYQTSDNKTRCTYENATYHVTVTYHEIECFDCHNYYRKVIVSEVVGYHNYVSSGERCDIDSFRHTYWQRCTGCAHVTETTVFCRGVHEGEPTNAAEDDHADE